MIIKHFATFLATATLMVAPLYGHLGISGSRSLGTLLPGNAAAVVSDQFVSGSFGWADGADVNWGDSHRLRAFQFVLTSPVDWVQISITRRDDAAQTGAFDAFTPGFSLYQRDGEFVSATHDGSSHTVDHLVSMFGSSTDPESSVDTNGNGVIDTVSLGGSGKEGAFNALGDWTIFNDSGASMEFAYVGHAADGDSDGAVNLDFQHLGTGTYYVFVGGNDYEAQISESSPYPNYGFTLNAQAIPEPGISLLLIGAGAAFACAFHLRRRG